MLSLDLSSIHVGVLRTSTRNQLAALMDPMKFVPSLKGVSRDYQGLAELMDFDHGVIKVLESSRSSPTESLLEEWEFKNDSTIGKLLEFLCELERFDVIDDLKQKFENDARRYLQNQVCLRQPDSSIRVPETTTSPAGRSDAEKSNLTVQDVGIIGQEKVHMYDAFVCYTEEDSDFVKILINKLEGENRQVRLFIEERDLLAGVTEYSAILELIQKRCYRMLVVVSPAFLSSKKREFQMMFAQSLSLEEQKRRVIPVIYKPCILPINLKILTCIYFTKEDTFGCMWKRLLYSIQPSQLNSASFSSLMSELSVQSSPLPSYQRSPRSERNDNTSENLISEFSSGVDDRNAEPSLSSSSSNLVIPFTDSGISVETEELNGTPSASSETGITHTIFQIITQTFKKKFKKTLH